MFKVSQVLDLVSAAVIQFGLSTEETDEASGSYSLTHSPDLQLALNASKATPSTDETLWMSNSMFLVYLFGIFPI